MAYSAALVFLAVVVGNHFYGMYSEFASGVAKDIVNAAIELTFIVLCLLFIVIVYFAYYRKKYVQRLQKEPKAQPTLNYEFRVLDG
ncbi:hypothetical protein FACS1894166_01150 [Bacilli bacterium]|nr:hypothetical protein FACS1894166_01150 [Bacilli bacterium]